jgi:hypothetical protein
LNWSKEEALAWEKRWSLPVAGLTLLAVAALLASARLGSSISGDGSAEILRSIHEHSSSETLTGIVQGFGFALFAAPLYSLFRAVRARSRRVRPQLLGLLLAAPLFLAASIFLGAEAKIEGANEFVAGNAKPTLSAKQANEDCSSQREDEGSEAFGEEFKAQGGETSLGACEKTKTEDDAASNAVSEASLSAPAAGLGLAGGLGIAATFFYTCLWAMRTGLLARFWSSFGMAAGVATVIGFVVLPMIWLVYFALLVAGWLPGGRPPAWEAGEAVPWPTPGQKAAEELQPEQPAQNPELEIGDTQTDGSERRKRKQRD